jgi:hypothetical protein
MMFAFLFPGLPVIIGTSYVFFLIFERPFLRGRRKPEKR